MKTIVITGVTSGIGLVTGEYLAKKGYKVYGLSRSIGSNPLITSLVCDVSNMEQVKNAFAQIDSPIDVIINNAGMGISGPVEMSPQEDISKIISTNLVGVINVCQVAIPYLRLTKGKIINIGSVAGELSIPFQTFYSMTKAAVASFSEGLNNELRPFSISVTTVMPGDTKTKFTQNRQKTNIDDEFYGLRFKRSIEKMEKDEQKGKNPLSVAKTIFHVIKRKKPPIKVVVGWEYRLIVFLKRFLPNRLVNWLIYQIYGR
ncbi:MAG: SDR family NAD(P)-dependent oxidoreductase [Bacilli bacterium]